MSQRHVSDAERTAIDATRPREDAVPPSTAPPFDESLAARPNEASDPSDSRTMPTPLVGEGDRFYATRIRQLTRLELDETEARSLWLGVVTHRRSLRRQLGRDVGQQVALLDFVLNLRPRLTDPRIIEGTELEAIEHQAVADTLTGLYNRNYFDVALAREMERYRRYGGPMSLLVLDLDQFKAINDMHGHSIGDRVLRRVAALILRHVRATDIACRYGGDELAVILPDTPAEEGRVVAERICQDVEASFASEPVSAIPVRVTASAGIAAVTEGDRSREQLIEDADRALYTAKRDGGNGVVSCSSNGSR